MTESQFPDDEKQNDENTPVDPDARVDQTMDSDEFPADARVDRTMDSDEFPADARVDRTMDSDEFPADARVDQTMDSAEFPADARVDRTIDSDEFPADARVDRTIDSDEFPADRRIEATIDSAEIQAAKRGGGTGSFELDDAAEGVDRTIASSQQSLGGSTADDVQATIDSGEIDENATRQMTQVWGEAAVKGRPGMTIKTDESIAVNEKSTLVIQTRAFRSADTTAQTMRADYDLLQTLGEGGMGVVYMARQASIDRTVAVKMLKRETAKDENQRRKFLSEAVITGDLDHPNIVPIYDLGTNNDGALFYAMKRVQGTPWEDRLPELSLTENLEILLKVADAVGFAHARGIIHRDLKPENVMLGEFGEVLVMDWGLAVPTRRFKKSNNVATSFSMGGTPAYMAPEMALGPFERISYASDIYLLGGILYEIVTGHAPHTGKNVTKCLIAASRNRITPTKKQGELVAIALRAMATDPKDRYPTVKDFQQAIRGYLSHSESLALTARAKQQLAAAVESNDYQDFAQSVFAFQEAINLWSDNEEAARGLLQAKLAYANNAFEKGDFDLGASLLDCSVPEHNTLHEKIETARQEREARQRRLKAAKRAVFGMAALVFIVVSIAFIAVNESRKKAVAARAAEEIARIAAEHAKREAEQQWQRAESEKQRAEREWKRAEEERQKAVAAKEQEEAAKLAAIKAQTEAERARDKEEQAKLDAVAAREKEAEARKLEAEARKAAELAKQEAIESRDAAIEAEREEAIAKARAEQQAYIALIGLAAAKIEENAFGTARQLLSECKPELANWEWRRLHYVCNQGFQDISLGVPLESVDATPEAERLVAGGWNGTARVWSPQSSQPWITLPHAADSFVNAVAFSPDGRFVATGSSDRDGGYLRLWDAATGELVRRFDGHTDTVLSVSFSHDGSRLLSSSYDETARLWDTSTGELLHTYIGHDWWVWSARFSPDEKRIVTASHDGSVIVWNTETGEMIGAPFIGHRLEGSQTPVYIAVFSPDGQWVASGGMDNRVLLWKPEEIEPFDYAAAIRNEEPPQPPYRALVKHQGAVRSIAFSQDGQRLISGAQDNTVNVWETATGALIKSLRGHNGYVQACRCSKDGSVAISCSSDGTVKIWDIDGYEEARVLRGEVLHGHLDAVLSASYSRDGQQILTASRDRSARAWDPHTGRELRTFREGHEFTASAVYFFPGGKHLLTTSVDNTARVWDLATGAEIADARIDGAGRRGVATISQDGRWVLTGGGIGPDGTWAARLWDVEAKKSVHELSGHQAEVSAVAISPDARLLFTGDSDGRGTIWDRETGEEVCHFWDDDLIVSAVFLPDGEHLLTANTLKTVRQWRVTSGEAIQWSLPHPGPIYSMALSADGQTLMTSCADGKVRVWNVQAGTQRLVLDLQGGPAAIAQNLRRSLSEYGWEEGVFAKKCNLPAPVISNALAGKGIPDATSLKRMAEVLEMKPESLLRASFAVAVSPDGSRGLTVSAEDRQVRLWDLATGEEIRYPSSASQLGPFLDLNGPIHRGLVWGAAFSPDGTQVATVGGDSARLWTLRRDVPPARRELMNFSPHGAVAAASFSPDGRYVVTGSWDNSARVWDATTGEVVCKLGQRVGQPHVEHSGRVNWAAFSPDGQYVVTASDDRTAKLWSTSDWALIRTFRGHRGPVLHAVFSHDSRRLLTSSADTTAKIWDVDSGESLFDLTEHSQAVLQAAFSPRDDLIVTGSADNTAKLWQVKAGGVEVLKELKGHTAAVTSVAFSPDQDATRVVTGSEDYTAILWDTDAGQEVLMLKGHTQGITSVCFSPDGKSILTSSRDGTAIVWLTEPAGKQRDASVTPPQG